MNFTTFFRTLILQNICKWLLLSRNTKVFMKVINPFLQNLLKNFEKQRNKCRSSRTEVFCIKDILKNFAKLTGKYLRWSLFFDLTQEINGTINGNTGRKWINLA